MYSLTNTGGAMRIVYDRRRKAVPIAPGKTREVDLDPIAAHRLGGEKSGLKVEKVEAFAEPPASASLPVSAGPAVRTPEQLLVAVEDDMPYATFRREAARTLGDEWPGGKPSREQIVKLLHAKMGL